MEFYAVGRLEFYASLSGQNSVRSAFEILRGLSAKFYADDRYLNFNPNRRKSGANFSRLRKFYKFVALPRYRAMSVPNAPGRSGKISHLISQKFLIDQIVVFIQPTQLISHLHQRKAEQILPAPRAWTTCVFALPPKTDTPNFIQRASLN